MDKNRLVVYILVCSLLTGITVYAVLKLTGSKQPGVYEGQAGEEDRHGRTEVFLYFGSAADAFLVAEKKTVYGSTDPMTVSKNILDALISGPSGKTLVRTLPENVNCRAFYLTDAGVAYVDFSTDIRDKHPGGSEAELMAIYSIVNSLILNVDDIKKVKILIEGNEADTLAGHIDLRFPFDANIRMIR